MSWLSVWSTGSETPMLAWFGGCELKEQEHDIKTQQAKLKSANRMINFLEACSLMLKLM